MKQLTLLPACLCLLACTHYPPARSVVFANPERFVNLPAHVCGYMIDSSNIVESPDRNDTARRGGLSIAEKGPLDPRRRGRVCVEGQIVYLGCETGPVACFDVAFDYGIRVRSIIDSPGRR